VASRTAPLVRVTPGRVENGRAILGIIGRLCIR
jgi:hypothetical protein